MKVTQRCLVCGGHVKVKGTVDACRALMAAFDFQHRECRRHGLTLTVRSERGATDADQ